MHAEINACMRNLGACMRKRLGAKHADVGCKVCGCLVQSMRMLGASMRKLLGQVCCCLVQVYGTVGCLPDSR